VVVTILALSGDLSSFKRSMSPALSVVGDDSVWYWGKGRRGIKRVVNSVAI